MGGGCQGSARGAPLGNDLPFTLLLLVNTRLGCHHPEPQLRSACGGIRGLREASAQSAGNLVKETTGMRLDCLVEAFGHSLPGLHRALQAQAGPLYYSGFSAARLLSGWQSERPWDRHEGLIVSCLFLPGELDCPQKWLAGHTRAVCQLTRISCHGTSPCKWRRRRRRRRERLAISGSEFVYKCS